MKEPMSNKNPTLEPYDIQLDNKVGRCPYITSKQYGDEGIDLCLLSAKPSGRLHPCILMSKDKCDILDNILNSGYTNKEEV